MTTKPTPFRECSEAGIVYRLATPEDAEAIIELCVAEFYPRMPLLRHVGATSHKDVAATIGILPAIVAQGVSLVAEDAATNQLIGARLSIIECRGITRRKHPLLTEPTLAAQFPKHCQVIRLVDRVESLVDYFSLFPVDRALAFKVIVVKESWGGRGIGRLLVENSMRLARHLGLGLAVVSAESRFAQRIFETLGFQQIAAIGYGDYADPVTGDQPFAGLADTTVHKEAVMYAKLIN